MVNQLRGTAKPVPPTILFFLCLFYALFPSSSVLASNGAISYAHPIEPIVVDGNLSDWPESLISYPINRFYLGNDPKSAEDYTAWFKVAYNLAQQQLYIAIEVTDDSYVADTAQTANWTMQDGHLLYIDAKHAPEGSAGILYILNQYKKEIAGNKRSWDPDAANASWDQVEAKMKHANGKIVYEWSFHLGEKIKTGQVIGLDHVIVDRDASDKEGVFSFIAWGPNTGKSQSPSRLGDVLLVDTEIKLGQLKGQLKWEKGISVRLPKRVRVQSIDHAGWSLTAAVDTLGYYDLKLPPGQYTLSLPYPTYGKQDIRIQQDSKLKFQVSSNGLSKAPLFTIQKHPKLDLMPEEGLLHQFSAEDSKQLDQFVETYRAYYSIPGVSLALIKDNKLVYHKTYGHRNAYTQEAVEDNTLFQAASITKSVFAIAVNRLAERGVIDLDRPLYQYLPFEAIAHDDRYKLITGRFVLSHQTGFPNWAWMNEDGKIDIKFTPGTKYGYSGEGFEYLGRVVAHITGKDLETILREEVLEPFNLYNTHFSHNKELEKVASFGHYDATPTPLGISESPGMAYSMYTEAKAFTNFMIGLMKQEHLSPKGYQEMLKTQRTITREEPLQEGEIDWKESFGLGFNLQESPYGLVFGHGGNNGDFQCLYEIYPEQKIGWVAYTNNDMGGDLCQKLQEFLITGKREKGIK